MDRADLAGRSFLGDRSLYPVSRSFSRVSARYSDPRRLGYSGTRVTAVLIRSDLREGDGAPKRTALRAEARIHRGFFTCIRITCTRIF
jgi:hypothetical protein